MGCILFLFPFLWIINVQFTNFGFFIFKYNDIGLLWSKITIFFMEITLKLFLHTKYGRNNPNWGRLGLKNSKLHFFDISRSSKFIVNINVQLNVTHSIFIINRFFFWNARNNVLYQNQEQLKLPKSANYRCTVPLKKTNFLENISFSGVLQKTYLLWQFHRYYKIYVFISFTMTRNRASYTGFLNFWKIKILEANHIFFLQKFIIFLVLPVFTGKR